VEDK